MPLEKQVAEQCQGEWITTLFRAPFEKPLSCLWGTSCLCCAVYDQRSDLLDITGEPYVCCGGLYPVGPLRNPQSRSMMAFEAFFCPWCALHANRYIIQTRFDKANTACDNLILQATCLCTCFMLASKCFRESPRECDNCAFCANSIFAGCMHAQQQVEIDSVKENGYFGPIDSVFDVLPPIQQEMIQLGKPMGGGTGGSDTIGADGVLPQPADATKTQFEDEEPAPKAGVSKYSPRAALAGLCFWPAKGGVPQSVV